MVFSPQIKTKVINIGINFSIGNLEECKSLFQIEPFYYWGDKFMTDKLNNQELLLYFRGLVIIEKMIGSCGSTTPAARVYREIERRNLDTDLSHADWAFQYSNNEYIPFGFIRHGERTAYEYIQWREDFYNRIYQEKIDKKERKKQQLKCAQEIIEQKKKRDKTNSEFYQRIMKLSPQEQVSAILSDDKHLLFFYMPIINMLIEDENVSFKILEPILKKLTKMKDTPFNKRLKNRILSKH